MTIRGNHRDFGFDVIEDYLATVKSCLEHRKRDGGVRGAPATLLLFCVVDAISSSKYGRKGIGTNRKGIGTNLEILKEKEYCHIQDEEKIQNLIKFYRNKLSHAASIPTGLLLSPDPFDVPFLFDGHAPIQINVFPFYDMVSKMWRLENQNFNPTSLADVSKNLHYQSANFLTGFSPAGSGVVEPTISVPDESSYEPASLSGALNKFSGSS